MKHLAPCPKEMQKEVFSKLWLQQPASSSKLSTKKKKKRKWLERGNAENENAASTKARWTIITDALAKVAAWVM